LSSKVPAQQILVFKIRILDKDFWIKPLNAKKHKDFCYYNHLKKHEIDLQITT
jgi:hypothetical protein